MGGYSVFNEKDKQMEKKIIKLKKWTATANKGTLSEVVMVRHDTAIEFPADMTWEAIARMLAVRAESVTVGVQRVQRDHMKDSAMSKYEDGSIIPWSDLKRERSGSGGSVSAAEKTMRAWLREVIEDGDDSTADMIREKMVKEGWTVN
jgi:asparagine synthetase B (glutamine-hydrolysing)